MTKRTALMRQLIDQLNSTTKPTVQLLAELRLPPEQFQRWLTTPVGRKAMRRLRRALATFREIDLARGGAGGATRLLAAVDGTTSMTAQDRAVAVALVNLARTRRSAPNRALATDGAPPALQVDPELLDALNAAQGQGEAGSEV